MNKLLIIILVIIFPLSEIYSQGKLEVMGVNFEMKFEETKNLFPDSKIDESSDYFISIIPKIFDFPFATSSKVKFMFRRKEQNIYSIDLSLGFDDSKSWKDECLSHFEKIIKFYKKEYNLKMYKFDNVFLQKPLIDLDDYNTLEYKKYIAFHNNKIEVLINVEYIKKKKCDVSVEYKKYDEEEYYTQYYKHALNGSPIFRSKIADDRYFDLYIKNSGFDLKYWEKYDIEITKCWLHVLGNTTKKRFYDLLKDNFDKTDEERIKISKKFFEKISSEEKDEKIYNNCSKELVEL